MYFLAYKAVYFVNNMQVVERAMYAIHDPTTSHHTTLAELPLHGSANNKLRIDDLMMIYVAFQKNNKSLETTQTIFQEKQYKTSASQY